MEVGHVARDMKRGDLPLSVAVLAETPDKAVGDQAGMINPLAQTHEIAVTSHPDGMGRQGKDRLLLFFAQRGASGELDQESLEG